MQFSIFTSLKSNITYFVLGFEIEMSLYFSNFLEILSYCITPFVLTMIITPTKQDACLNDSNKSFMEAFYFYCFRFVSIIICKFTSWPQVWFSVCMYKWQAESLIFLPIWQFSHALFILGANILTHIIRQIVEESLYIRLYHSSKHDF